ncbi:MAG: hypothetical protein ABEL76_02690, partial [Bradymonadaceae bacterium]
FAILSVMFTAAGCAHVDRTDRQDDGGAADCSVEPDRVEQAGLRTQKKLRRWLRFLRGRGSKRRLAVESYPGRNEPIARRSYLYDNALALLWSAWIGKRRRARALARTLIATQREDGSWSFSIDFSGQAPTPTARVRTGAVAWAAHALSYFEHRAGGRRVRRAVDRAVEYLIEQRYSPDRRHLAGLIGPGRWVDGPTPKMAVTEHQIDAHMVLRSHRPGPADALRERILEALWMPDEGRFAVAVHEDGLDSKRALDASGAWGALWLQSLGRPHLARRSFAYVLQSFRVRHDGFVGYRPYRDAVGQYDALDRDHVFTEGSFSVGLAAHRLGHDLVARRMVRLGAELNCRRGPGIPYSTVDVTNFPTDRAAASSLWYLFLEREWRTGEVAPLFTGFDRGSTRTEATGAAEEEAGRAVTLRRGDR